MRRIKSISTSIVYDIPAGPAIRWQVNVNGSLTGCRGRIWLTREGDQSDYWVDPGVSVAVQPGDVLWATSEGDAEGRLTLHFVPVPAPARGMRGWMAAMLHGLPASRQVHGRPAIRR